MTSYIVCHECGYKLFKVGDGSNMEIYCPKCKAKLLIEIKDGQSKFKHGINEKLSPRLFQRYIQLRFNFVMTV